MDDDGDGRLDFKLTGGDRGCDSPSDTTETSNILTCDDGLDNDLDGAKDWGDSECYSYPGYYNPDFDDREDGL